VIIITLLLFMYGARVFLTQKYQLFGKQALHNGDARNAAILFILPFVASVLSIAFTSANIVALADLMNGLSYAFLAIAVAVLGYTAFFAPDATLDRGPVALSDSVTTSAAAQYMNISEEEVYQLIESGLLTARRIGNEYRIHKEVLIGYFQTRQELAARREAAA
jgi:excisionase family DNA binding protein